MEEKVMGVKFVFDSGRTLEEAPKDQPFSELLSGFSTDVLEVLDRENLVIVGGESGLGKSELFLGNQRRIIKAGGLADQLASQGRTFKLINASNEDYAVDQVKRILEADDREKPEVVFVDESGAMFDSKQLRFNAVKDLLEDGRKVVLVGGGNLQASKQNELIKDGLKTTGVEVSESQMFEFPALTLNFGQCSDLLMVLHPEMDSNQAGQVVKTLDRQNIPKIFRAIFYCDPDPREITQDSMNNYIKHITVVPK
jgi:hypothetical protein